MARNVVHITHEALIGIGGIGAVVRSILATTAWRARVARTLLAGVWRAEDAARSSLLGLAVQYGPGGSGCPWAARLAEIERTYGVSLVYGRRGDVEILLVDPGEMPEATVAETCHFLHVRTGIDLPRHEWSPEVRAWTRAAPALVAASCVIVESPLFLCHDWMAVPTALAAQDRGLDAVWMAHEVPLARLVAEGHPGGEYRLSAILGLLGDASLADVFPEEAAGSYAHAFVVAAAGLSTIAVSSMIERQLRALARPWQGAAIRVVPNGVPAATDAPSDSEARVLRWVAKTTGFEPTAVFTHVGRPVKSKGWTRDFHLLRHLDARLDPERDRVALVLVASAVPGGRDPADAERWRREFGWPVRHGPDLVGYERAISEMADLHNAMASATKVVFVNQHGFGPEACGGDFEGLSIPVLRAGALAELDMATYEPFGIAPVEGIAHGTLGVVTPACGCLEVASTGLLVAQTLGRIPHDLRAAMRIDREAAWQQDWALVGAAGRLVAALHARGGRAMRRAEGRRLVEEHGWEAVVRDRLLPALRI